jgi:hypothetical protein
MGIVPVMRLMVLFRALSSVVEHLLDVKRAGGSIPSARTEMKKPVVRQVFYDVRDGTLFCGHAKP